MEQKISIRFFDDTEIRAVWDDEHSKWWFSVLDIVGVLRNEPDYEKNRNYWKYLKAKLKSENNQLGSVTTQFKFTAPDGKKRLANVIDYNGQRQPKAIDNTIYLLSGGTSIFISFDIFFAGGCS